MGFPTRACMELTSDDAMKQSLRLVKDVSLSMSWNAESLPAERAIIRREASGFGGRGVSQIKKTARSDCEINAISYLRFIAALGNYNY